MINYVSLVGFKSFVDQGLSLNKLTILTGLNSTGKSSIIQSLLMLEKAANTEDNILLEGLGSVADIKNNYTDDKKDIELTVKDGINAFSIKIPSDNAYEVIDSSMIDFPQIIYISAHRYGSKNFLPIFNDVTRKYRIGPNGENLFQCIEQLGGKILNERLRHEKSIGDTLEYNIKGWLNSIVPNVEFKYKLDKTSDTSYSTFDEHRATNVGFGLSYILPVITALLIGTIIPNSLVILENPEAHLHPRGQTEIARLIALCSQVGAQIIIETHSDHIINGVLVQCKKFEEEGKGIEKSLVKIYQFQRESSSYSSVPIEIKILKDGKIDKQPKDFFDQTEKDLTYLLGF